MERGRQRNKIITVKSLAAMLSLAVALDCGAGLDEMPASSDLLRLPVSELPRTAAAAEAAGQPYRMTFPPQRPEKCMKPRRHDGKFRKGRGTAEGNTEVWAGELNTDGFRCRRRMDRAINHQTTQSGTADPHKLHGRIKLLSELDFNLDHFHSFLNLTDLNF